MRVFLKKMLCLMTRRSPSMLNFPARRGSVKRSLHPSPERGGMEESHRAGFAAWRPLTLIAFSGYELASHFLGRSGRRCVAVGALGGGVRVRRGSRIGRAGVSVGLLVALRVVGEGRGKRAGAQNQRSGGGKRH